MIKNINTQHPIKCNICDSKIKVHDKAIILKKYNVTYYICINCGFIQTEYPFWIEEAYSKAIAATDTGIMSRNLQNVSNLLFLCKFLKNPNCLDFGGGHGIFTRIMRDNGYNFYHYDKYAENLFAIGFEGILDNNNKYDLITSFEIFEHFVNPMDEIKNIIEMTDILYFSTELIPNNVPFISDWWYYSPSTGQHISFYTKKSLEIIAERFNFLYYTANNNIHIFYKNKLIKNKLKYIKYYNKLVNKLNIQNIFKKCSLTWDDHLKITEDILFSSN